MTQNIVGKIPDFTDDTPTPEVVEPTVPDTQTPVEEIKEVPAEEAVIEKETPVTPTEKPLEAPAVQVDTVPLPEDAQKLQKAITGLQQERVNLLKEISELKGNRREIKQEQLDKVNKEIDALKDLHPDDVSTIDRVLRAKGYMSKEEVSQMFYESAKQEELEKFLDKYPEYKPENDPGDANWKALERELGYFKLPSDPRRIHEVLERAHKGVVKVPSGPSIPVQKRQVEIASHGAGGAQRPSPTGNKFTAEQRSMYLQGGWSNEEIDNMEKRL